MEIRKIIINAIGWSLAALSILTMALSCDVDDDAPMPRDSTIAVILSHGTTVTLFTEALERIGYLDNLHDNHTFTVFAPSDDAFDAYLEDNGYDGLEDVPNEALEKLVKNHLIPRAVLCTSELSDLDSPYIESSAGYSLLIRGDGEDISINGRAQIDGNAQDVLASNGIIHRMDAVIEIPTVATFLEVDDDFSDFYTALTMATPDHDFMATLKSLETDDESEAPFTIFVPDNESIQSFFESHEDWEDLEDLDQDQLAAILKHHIILTKAISKEDLQDDADGFGTWEGDSLSFSVEDDEFTITDGSGNEGIAILTFDIKTRNGIIHRIGSVLIPDMEN